ncbi:NUDIX hydrolase [Maribellus mangrovi]|uniref:NUDIX hydrolase n=1 Tax=Maribellus mangrovi TaxID=3133146 RepID=UPI0030EEA013
MQKYKVFLNEKRILFTSFGEITFSTSKKNITDFSSRLNVKNWLEDFLKSSEQEAVFESENPRKTFDDFCGQLIKLEAAGGVVKRDGKLLFIFRNGKWDLPKGKIDKGETREKAALREVEEECGIRGHRIVKELPTSYHIYQSPYKKNKGEWIVKPTFWFEMEYTGSKNGVPETDEGITEIRWFKPSELDEVLANTYGNLKELIESYQ